MIKTNLVFSDSHCHTNPVYGIGARSIAKAFKKNNGWFIALVSLPPYHYGFSEPSIESYVKVIELMVREARVVREEGLETRILIGFHPAEVDEYIRRGVEPVKVLELATNVLELIGKYHDEGFVDGIGEVGRQHYSTNPMNIVLSELVMVKAFEIAKDKDMVVQIHCEQSGVVTAKSIEFFVEKTGLPKVNLAVHHVDYITGFELETRGVWHTIPIKSKDLVKALKEGRKWALIESDYIDDPKRPGVSAYPWEIPLKLNELVKNGVIDVNVVEKLNVDNVSKFFKLDKAP